MIKYIALSLLVAVLSAVLLSSIGLTSTSGDKADNSDLQRLQKELDALKLETQKINVFEGELDGLEAEVNSIEATVNKLENSKDNNYIGTWYFLEPIKDVSMLEVMKKYKFSFSCYINGSFETHNYSNLYIYQASDENYTLRYGYDDGSSVLAYRSKYGEFVANSYQIITIESEPCDEIKAFLDANALYMGRLSSEYLNMLDEKLNALTTEVEALKGSSQTN